MVGGDRSGRGRDEDAVGPSRLDAPRTMPGLLRSGGAGFLAVTVVALLVIGGLWVTAREAPSAKVARAVAPTPTVTGVRGPFAPEMFPTARPMTPRRPTPALPAWGLPRRRSSMPTPTGWEQIVGAIRDGDATGLLPLSPDAAVVDVATEPSPTPQLRRPEQ